MSQYAIIKVNGQVIGRMKSITYKRGSFKIIKSYYPKLLGMIRRLKNFSKW